MDKFKRGTLVGARVYGGGEAILRVWGTGPRGVILLTNDEEFKKMASGKPALWPVAFHPEDVRVLESESI